MTRIVLLASLVLLQPQDPIKNFRVRFCEPNPKTGEQEVVALIEGDEATPRRQGVSDIVRPRVTYYTEPDASGKSQTVRLSADRGEVDEPAKTLTLLKNVRVKREDGTTLDSDTARAEFGEKKVVTLSGNVRIHHERPDQGSATVTSDFARIVGDRHVDPKTGKAIADPEQIEARGNVRLEEHDGARASAETLVWTFPPKDAPPAEAFDTALLTGAPLVEVIRGSNKIRARTVEIVRLKGISVFHDNVSATLAPADNPDAKPFQLTARTLTARAAAQALEEIEASGNVVLKGLTEGSGGGEPGRAEADRFVWNEIEQRGLLEATPFVRITQGEGRIIAPTVVLAGRSTVVLKGPKRIRLSEVRDGNPIEFTATCRGDLVLDSSAGRVMMEDDCAVRTTDLSLRADRVLALLDQAGKGLKSMRASGRVRAHQTKEGMTVYGDWLTYDPARKRITVTGFPHIFADKGSEFVTARELRYDEKTGETELIRGEKPVRVVIRRTPPK